MSFFFFVGLYASLLSRKTTLPEITRWWSVREQAITPARCLWVLGRK